MLGVVLNELSISIVLYGESCYLFDLLFKSLVSGLMLLILKNLKLT